MSHGDSLRCARGAQAADARWLQGSLVELACQARGESEVRQGKTLMGYMLYIYNINNMYKMYIYIYTYDMCIYI